jgi:hypothetical protein
VFDDIYILFHLNTIVKRCLVMSFDLSITALHATLAEDKVMLYMQLCA